MSIFDKKEMAKYVHWIYGVLFGTVLILIVLLYHQNKVLTSRINTTNKSISKNLKIETLSSEKSFKEDYYITQQSSDTTLILTCFGVGFGLFSFFTYQSVIGLISDEVKQIKDNYVTHEYNYNVQHSKLSKIEIDLFLQMGYLYKERAIVYNQKGDIQNCINSSVFSCEQFCKLLDIFEDKESSYSRLVNLNLHEMIKAIGSITVKSETQIIFKDFDEIHYKRRTELILSHLKGEAYFEFYESIKKLQFEKYEIPFIVV